MGRRLHGPVIATLLLLTGLVLASYQFSWDVAEPAALGEGRNEPLLLTAVFVKSLLKYSPAGMWSSNCLTAIPRPERCLV